MVQVELLKSLKLFEELSDEMLERLAGLAELRFYEQGAFLNNRKRAADYFYLILEGQISLEEENLIGESMRLETIAPGGTLGFSSLIETDKRYLSDARALTPVKLLSFPADELTLLFYQDFELGFLIMKKNALIAKRRLMYRIHPITKVGASAQSFRQVAVNGT